MCDLPAQACQCNSCKQLPTIVSFRFTQGTSVLPQDAAGHHNRLSQSGVMLFLNCLFACSQVHKASLQVQFPLHTYFCPFKPQVAELCLCLVAVPPDLSQSGSLSLAPGPRSSFRLLFVPSLHPQALLSQPIFLTSPISSDITLFIPGAPPMLVKLSYTPPFSEPCCSLNPFLALPPLQLSLHRAATCFL